VKCPVGIASDVSVFAGKGVLMATHMEPKRGRLMEPGEGQLMDPLDGHVMDPLQGHPMEPSACEAQAVACALAGSPKALLRAKAPRDHNLENQSAWALPSPGGAPACAFHADRRQAGRFEKQNHPVIAFSGSVRPFSLALSKLKGWSGPGREGG